MYVKRRVGLFLYGLEVGIDGVLGAATEDFLQEGGEVMHPMGVIRESKLTKIDTKVNFVADFSR